jgi:hypothetical protein
MPAKAIASLFFKKAASIRKGGFYLLKFLNTPRG